LSLSMPQTELTMSEKQHPRAKAPLLGRTRCPPAKRATPANLMKKLQMGDEVFRLLVARYGRVGGKVWEGPWDLKTKMAQDSEKCTKERKAKAASTGGRRVPGGGVSEPELEARKQKKCKVGGKKGKTQ